MADEVKIVVKGTAVEFVMRQGRDVVAPSGYGLMHDAVGGLLPRCTLLIGPFRKGGSADDAEVSRAAVKYLGPEADIKRGSAGALPDCSSLDDWRDLGEVQRIYYQRGGDYRGYYTHPFSGRVFLVLPGETRLYRRGRWLRLQLPWACRLNERGFIAP